MADFLTNLWTSIFTPGTTPTLLVATNATFAALQVLLAALFLATYSVHFAVLSVLCGGLWYSINWFAVELQVAQAQAAKEDEAKKGAKRKKDWRKEGDVGDSADDEGEDTEVEDISSLGRSQVGLDGGGTEARRQGGKNAGEEIVDASTSSGVLVGGDSAEAAVEQAIAGAEMRQRRMEDVDRSGEVSTDSEWEKVSQDGDR